MEACGAMRQNVICAIGPAIGPCCYEVDADFVARFFERLGQNLCHGLFVSVENGKYRCDLKTLNARLLRASGVPQTQIDVSTCCTACDPHLFFSHRATQGKRGTMGAVIEVPENA